MTRFKGLGEMNPMQLRVTTLAPDTRRLVQLTLGEGNASHSMLDMLLAKKRASDRKAWLETKGALAEISWKKGGADSRARSLVIQYQ